MKNEQIQKVLEALSKSRFRSSFHLRSKELAILQEKGLPIIHQHAIDFITKRLASATPLNDGKQTPFKGHPVFIAQHATATCCRTCLMKWHCIPKGRQMTQEEIDYVVDVISAWLSRE